MSCENLEIKQESIDLKIEDQNSTSDEENSDHDGDPLDVLKTRKNSDKKTKNNNKSKNIEDDDEGETTEKSSNDQPCLPGGLPWPPNLFRFPFALPHLRGAAARPGPSNFPSPFGPGAGLSNFMPMGSRLPFPLPLPLTRFTKNKSPSNQNQSEQDDDSDEKTSPNNFNMDPAHFLECNLEIPIPSMNNDLNLHDGSGSPKKNKRAFSLDFKLQVVEEAKKSNNRHTAREHEIDESLVRSWRKNEAKMRETCEKEKNVNTKRFRLDGSGRKVKNKELEEKLFSWVMSQRAGEIHVTQKNICEMARHLSNNPEFTASNGWCQNFIRRYGLSDSNPKPPKQQPPKPNKSLDLHHQDNLGVALGHNIGVTNGIDHGIYSNADQLLPNNTASNSDDIDKNMLQHENRILKSKLEQLKRKLEELTGAKNGATIVESNDPNDLVQQNIHRNHIGDTEREDSVELSNDMAIDNFLTCEIKEEIEDEDNDGDINLQQNNIAHEDVPLKFENSSDLKLPKNIQDDHP